MRSAQQVLYYVNDAKYIAQCCGRFESRSNLFMLFNGFLLAWPCRLTISMSMRCGRSDDVAKSDIRRGWVTRKLCKPILVFGKIVLLN